MSRYRWAASVALMLVGVVTFGVAGAAAFDAAEASDGGTWPPTAWVSAAGAVVFVIGLLRLLHLAGESLLRRERERLQPRSSGNDS